MPLDMAVARAAAVTVKTPDFVNKEVEGTELIIFAAFWSGGILPLGVLSNVVGVRENLRVEGRTSLCQAVL